MTSPIGCAVIGYGPMHNFGWAHCAWMDATPDLKLVAVCDLDPTRTDAAKEAFPAIRTYNNVSQVWQDGAIQLVSIVTPHYTHCALAVEALEAGKHVVVEKAMCLSTAQATAMVDAAERAGRTLAIHHNRRHDGNYRRIKEIVRSGQIGDVFHIELSAGGFSEFQHGWYSEKAKSGGAFYFWGPHAVDWVLNLVPHRVAGVNGFIHNLVWHNVSNEDQVRAILRFDNGTVADITWSHIAAVGKPLWRILGTRGGILDTGVGGNVGYEKQIRGPVGGSLTLVTMDAGERREQQVPYLESDWDQYWQDLANHLLRGAPVPVSGYDGRRTIAVFEAADRSAQSGQTEKMEYERGPLTAEKR